MAVGILSACQFGPILLFAPWAGVVVDRMEKRRLLFITQGLEMGQSLALAALAFMHDVPLIAFYLTAVAGGTMLAFDNPVRRTFVNEMVALEDVPNAVTLYSAMVNLSRIAGPAIAGLLVVSVGYGWCFTIDAASYTSVLVALAMMRTGELRRLEREARGAGQIRAGLRYITTVPEIWIPFLMLLIVGTFSYNFTVLFPLFVEKGLNGSDTDFTFLYAIFSTGAVVGALAVARRSTVTIRTVTLGALWLGVTLLVLSLMPNVGLAIAVAALVGGSSVAYMTATSAIAQIRAAPRMIGRVMAIQAVLFAGTKPIGGPILGGIADAFGARTAVGVGAVGALLAAAFGWVAARRLERERLAGR